MKRRKKEERKKKEERGAEKEDEVRRSWLILSSNVARRRLRWERLREIIIHNFLMFLALPDDMHKERLVVTNIRTDRPTD